jgi:hypothetical protein
MQMANIHKKHMLRKRSPLGREKRGMRRKKRMSNNLHFLLAGNAPAARKALEKGGIKLTGNPSIKQSDVQNPHR